MPEQQTSKHTPGPWRVGQDGSFGISVWGEEHVADVKTWAHGEREANARLISAAPELLDALLSFMPEIDQCAWSRSDTKMLERIAKARAALAKAGA